MRRLTGKGLRGNWSRDSGRLARVIGATAIMTGVAGAAVAGSAAAQASWTPIKTLTAPRWEGVDPAISASAKGALLTAWEGINNADPSCGNQIQVRLRSSVGKWGRIHQLTPCRGPWMIFPAVAYNAAGGCHARDGLVAPSGSAPVTSRISASPRPGSA